MRRFSFYIPILFAAAVLVVAGTLPAAAGSSVPPLPKPRPGSTLAAPAPSSSAPVTSSAVPLPKPRPGMVIKGKTTTDINSGEGPLAATDTDETSALPAYPPHARIAMGKLQTYALGEEDTLLDVARHYRLGFVEARAANPEVDPWTPLPGTKITIPSFKLLPRAPQNGIVVNLAQMRMYYFNSSRAEPVTFPIGIGREGLQTPMGETSVIRKAADPVWYPTDRMREEKPWLPAAIPAGSSNPLGTHALYLGWPTFLIHGSNKPWAIGRRVSSGCMRMYPEDITDLFDIVPVGTKVTVVDQPILVGWIGDELYLEANPSKNQSNDIEITGDHEIKGLSNGLKKAITDAAGVPVGQINWDIAKRVIEERLGYPVVIANVKEAPPPPVNKPSHGEFKYN